MRTFVVLLFLLNVVYLAWNFNLANNSQPKPLLDNFPSPQDIQQLSLLSEVEVPIQQIENGNSQYCFSIGVFDNVAESETFVTESGLSDFVYQIQLIGVEGQPDYRVYMPPFNTFLAAQRRLDELKANDIESFIINSGELTLGISLGLFSFEESALTVQAELAAQGYPTAIQELAHTETELWVNLKELPEGGFSDSQWLQILEDSPGLQKIEKLCETIAPEP